MECVNSLPGISERENVVGIFEGLVVFGLWEGGKALVLRWCESRRQRIAEEKARRLEQWKAAEAWGKWQATFPHEEWTPFVASP